MNTLRDMSLAFLLYFATFLAAQFALFFMNQRRSAFRVADFIEAFFLALGIIILRKLLHKKAL